MDTFVMFCRASKRRIYFTLLVPPSVPKPVSWICLIWSNPNVDLVRSHDNAIKYVTKSPWLLEVYGTVGIIWWAFLRYCGHLLRENRSIEMQQLQHTPQLVVFTAEHSRFPLSASVFSQLQNLRRLYPLYSHSQSTKSSLHLIPRLLKCYTLKWWQNINPFVGNSNSNKEQYQTYDPQKIQYEEMGIWGKGYGEQVHFWYSELMCLFHPWLLNCVYNVWVQQQG